MMDELAGRISAFLTSLGPVGAALAGAAALSVLVLFAALLRGPFRRRDETAEQVEALARLQAETTGRLQTLAEILAARQADLGRTLGERIDQLAQRVGADLATSAEHSGEQLERLAERLAVIDRAQRTLADLSGEVTSLRAILGNKQTRGAFGQGRMEAIVRDGLPAAGYSFQATLSNGNRPDCLVHLPNDAAALVIDAKFPLESFERLKAAESPEHRAAALAQARRDLLRHVADVRERYFLPGETQDTALVFVPSEALFADIHEHLSDVVERAGRGRVLFVSPSLLMLSIQLVQAVLRDVRMREQAHLIQTEVRRLVEDVDRLRERTLNLQKHFGQANADIEQILVSTTKIARRGAKIDDVAFDDADRGASIVTPA